ncbi:hypothetical protein PCE1_001162 [Barthelona sp. PCE]
MQTNFNLDESDLAKINAELDLEVENELAMLEAELEGNPSPQPAKPRAQQRRAPTQQAPQQRKPQPAQVPKPKPAQSPNDLQAAMAQAQAALNMDLDAIPSSGEDSDIDLGELEGEYVPQARPAPAIERRPQPEPKARQPHRNPKAETPAVRQVKPQTRVDVSPAEMKAHSKDVDVSLKELMKESSEQHIKAARTARAFGWTLLQEHYMAALKYIKAMLANGTFGTPPNTFAPVDLVNFKPFKVETANTIQEILTDQEKKIEELISRFPKNKTLRVELQLTRTCQEIVVKAKQVRAIPKYVVKDRSLTYEDCNPNIPRRAIRVSVKDIKIAAMEGEEVLEFDGNARFRSNEINTAPARETVRLPAVCDIDVASFDGRKTALKNHPKSCNFELTISRIESGWFGREKKHLIGVALIPLANFANRCTVEATVDIMNGANKVGDVSVIAKSRTPFVADTANVTMDYKLLAFTGHMFNAPVPNITPPKPTQPVVVQPAQPVVVTESTQSQPKQQQPKQQQPKPQRQIPKSRDVHNPTKIVAYDAVCYELEYARENSDFVREAILVKTQTDLQNMMASGQLTPDKYLIILEKGVEWEEDNLLLKPNDLRVKKRLELITAEYNETKQALEEAN